jgi:hypothetical protein
LFIVVFVYVPFTVGQCLLFTEAGFHPARFVPGILFNLAMATAIIVLPLVLLASVTGSFAKMSLAVFLLVIFVAATAYLSNLLPSSSSPDYGMRTMYVLFVCAVAAIIVWQYATRRTSVSRSMVYGVAVLMAMLALFGPDDYPVEKIYPAHGANHPSVVELGFRTGDDSSSAADINPDDKKEVELSLPVTIGAIEKMSAVRVDFARVEIHGEHGSTMYRTGRAKG